jgi:hypothetical protein
VVAAAETGNVANLHVFGAAACKAPLKLRAQFASAPEMAAHVRTDTNFGFGRGRQVKMRVKTSDAVNLVKRSVRAMGKSFELRFGQKAVAKLDGTKVVEDHVLLSRVQIAAQASRNARRRLGCGISCILLSVKHAVHSAPFAFRGASRKRQRNPLTSPRRKRYKRTDSSGTSECARRRIHSYCDS